MASLRSSVKISWLLSVFALASSQLIDMSHVYDNTTIYWGNSTRFEHKLVIEGKLSNDVPFISMYDVTTAEHGGTHIDAPIHFAKGKWTVDQIPPGNLIGPAVVVDISAKASKDRSAELTVADLQKWEEDHEQIPDDSILFVFTGWGKYWPNYKTYMGTSTKNESLYRFPGIHEDAAQWLVDNRKIKGVGIDTASLDYGKSTTFSSHQILFKSNIYGLENVANLDKIPTKGAMVYALPMKIGRGSGGPVRIFAVMSNGVAGNLSKLPYYLLIFIVVMSFLGLH